MPPGGRYAAFDVETWDFLPGGDLVLQADADSKDSPKDGVARAVPAAAGGRLASSDRLRVGPAHVNGQPKRAGGDAATPAQHIRACFVQELMLSTLSDPLDAGGPLYVSAKQQPPQ